MTDDYSQHTLSDRLGVALGIIAFILLITGNAYAYDCSLADTGWWTLNESTSGYPDVCANYVNGTNNGATRGVSAVWNNGATFVSGDSDYVDLNFGTGAEFKGYMSGTGWINVIGWPAVFGTIVGQMNSAGADASVTMLMGVMANHSIRCGWSTGVGAWEFLYSDALDASKWYFTACTINSTHSCVYYNDTATTLDTKCDTAAVIPVSSDYQNWSIGRAGERNAFYIWATMDEIALFNETIDYADVFNLFTYNDFQVCSVDFTPTAAPINESQAFTGSKNANCGAWDGQYYWNYTRWDDLTTYFVGTTNPDSQALNYTGNWSVNFTATIGGVNYTKVQNVTVAERPDANFTVNTTAPYFVFDTIQFNDTSTDPNVPANEPMSAWYWDFGDGNTSTTQNATNIFILPGEYEVGLIVSSSVGLNSTEYTDNITINGFAVDVFDEVTLAAVPSWNMTITNSSGCSYTETNQANTWVWSNFTDVCTGSITITLTATGYIGRTYYAVYNVGSYINLDAYLLDSASGVYPVFIVRNVNAEAIQGAILSFAKQISGSYVTVSQATSDASGTTQVYLNPTVTYRIIVTAGGYNTYTTTSFTPVSTTYIITLTTNTSVTYGTPESVLYAYLYPGEHTVGNNTIVEFRCNDPWSNVNNFGFWIVNHTGDVVYAINSTASASCGIISVNLSAYLASLPAHQQFTTHGFVYRNGANYTYEHTYTMTGSWSAGLGNILGEFSDVDFSTGTFNATGAALMSQNDLSILAFVVVAAVTFGASLSFGWGAGIVGVVAAVFFAWFGWLPWILVGIGIAGMLAVYASRRWV